MNERLTRFKQWFISNKPQLTDFTGFFSVLKKIVCHCIHKIKVVTIDFNEGELKIKIINNLSMFNIILKNVQIRWFQLLYS